VRVRYDPRGGVVPGAGIVSAADLERLFGPTVRVAYKAGTGTDEKFNPYHGRDGRFSSGGNTVSGSSVSQALIAGESKIRDLPHESAFALDASGRRIFEKIGEPEGVDITPTEAATLRGSTFSHNHPPGSLSGFSAGDITFAGKYGLAEMRMVDQSGRYSLRSGSASGWNSSRFSPESVPSTISRARTSVIEEWTEGKLPASERHPVSEQQYLREETMSRVAKAIGAEFTVTRWSGIGKKASTVTQNLPLPDDVEEVTAALERRFEKAVLAGFEVVQRQIVAVLTKYANEQPPLPSEPVLLGKALAAFGAKADGEEVPTEADSFWALIERELERWFFPEIVNAAQAGIQSAASALQQIGMGIDWALVNIPVLKWSRLHAAETVRGITATTRSAVRELIVAWQEQGLGKRGLPDLIKALEPILGKSRAEQIGITEVTRAFAQGNEESYREVPGAVGQRWHTARDDRVCFPENTLVATATGAAPIQGIRPGDMVWTRQGLRQVLSVSKRSYTGPMVTIAAGWHTVTATPNHPFWTLEQGWLEARYLQVGHTLQSLGNQSIQLGCALNLQVGDSDHLPAVGLEITGLPRILGGVPVPVDAIDFQDDTQCRQQEVYAVAPNLGFLRERDAHSGKCLAHLLLRDRLPLKAAVAGKAAKLAFRVARAYVILLAAVATVDCVRRATAFLRTVVSVQSLLTHKGLAAAFTRLILGEGSSACSATNGIATGVDSIDGKGAAAYWTDLLRHLWRPIRLITLMATEADAALVVGCTGLKGSPTPFAYGRGRLSARSVVAFGGTEDSLTTNRLMFDGRFPATATGIREGHGNHLATIIPQRGLGRYATVYNLEVEGEPEYYANGLLVHNCSGCAPLDGKWIEFGGDFRTLIPDKEVRDSYKKTCQVPPLHNRCRCRQTCVMSGAGKALDDGEKFNPYHGANGRFSSSGGATSVHVVSDISQLAPEPVMPSFPNGQPTTMGASSSPEVLKAFNSELQSAFDKSPVLYRGTSWSGAESQLQTMEQTGKLTSGGWVMGERRAEGTSSRVSLTVSPQVASTFGSNNFQSDAVVFEFHKSKLQGSVRPVTYQPGASNSIMWEREVVGEGVRANSSSIKRVIVQKVSTNLFATPADAREELATATAFANSLRTRFKVPVAVVHVSEIVKADKVPFDPDKVY